MYEELIKNRSVYKDYKIYGPYTCRRDRRKRVVAYKSNVDKKTISYPKFIMECYLERYLSKEETIDHINRDFTDDRLNNLQILNKNEHISLDKVRVRDVNLKCVWCEKSFVVIGKKVKERNRNKAGPFCSRKCSGEYGAALQNNKIDKNNFTHKKIEIEYYYLDK